MKPIFIIPCFVATSELEQLTINALSSMRSADVFILAVDDGSPRDTTFMEYLADEVLHLEINSGFAVASNTGLQWAIDHGYKFIGCANNDIEVFPGWLDALVYPFTRYKDVGVTGLISSKERYPEGKPIFEYKVPKITSGGLLNHWMQSGGLLLTTRDVLLKVGLYDEQFEIGGEEDVDLFWRIVDAKYKLIMSGHSCFWHKEGATRWNDEIEVGFKEKNKQIEQKNYDRFFKKWDWDIRDQGLKFHETVLK